MFCGVENVKSPELLVTVIWFDVPRSVLYAGAAEVPRLERTEPSATAASFDMTELEDE
jgi:hypothetical protein